MLVADADAARFEDSDGDGRRIDDPVRMYLTQMGEIPLLDREQEIALAKKIEVTRNRFRRKVLECDYALRQVVETLKRVHAGDLPFDRTIKVSLTENLEKDKILQRMPHNLRTLEHLMEQNVEDFEQLIDERTAEEDQERAPRAAPAPPPQDRHAGRGAVDPHAEGPAADEEAGADLPADGRAGAARSRRSRATGRPRRSGPTWRRNCTT